MRIFHLQNKGFPFVSTIIDNNFNYTEFMIWNHGYIWRKGAINPVEFQRNEIIIFKNKPQFLNYMLNKLGINLFYNYEIYKC